jgi:endonuclease/exonuclease/phosphatase family metal-dependent hydrolase
MTYNAHSCVGTDRRLDPSRIADVIAAHDPDIIALQELDLARRRSKQEDQAARIAEHVGMHFHFHPALRVEDELYGDAILSRHPLQMIHAGELPTVPSKLAFETRGALWVSITVANRQVQFLNTHLGLSSRERDAQVTALLGPEWLGHPACQEPVILCGDFNALPNSSPHRRLGAKLRDAHRVAAKARRPTFPSRFPLLRLDYVFVSSIWEVLEVQVPATPLTRIASDHLPVIVDLLLPEQALVSNLGP